MFLRFLFCSCAALTLSVASAQELDNLSAASILICKGTQCVPSSSEMGHAYLVNQVNELMKNNKGKNITLCEASPEKYACTEQGFSFPVQSDMIQTDVTVSAARVIDAKPVKDEPGTDLILDYRLKAGDTFPQCQTSLTRLGVASAADVKMMSPQFNCKVTETNKTTFSLTYNVNYLDLDRGIIGAFYSVAANNALQGKKEGYVLMTLEKGVEMEPGEVFPYVAQLEAILNGSMPQINDSDMIDHMEAFWLKPTPFLNLPTPQFAPNNCIDFVGGCSAEMLNDPATAVPPAAEQIAQLTPAGVPSTTGLIQQKVEVMNKTTVLNGKNVPQTANLPVSSTQMMKNGEKEYQSLKQFEAQNAFVRKAAPLNQSQTVVPAQQPTPNAAPNKPAAQQQPTPNTVTNNPAVPQPTPNTATNNPAVPQPTPNAVPNKSQTPVQILTQPGVTLSDEEKAYIENLAKADEGKPVLPAKIDVQSDLTAVMVAPNPSPVANSPAAQPLPGDTVRPAAGNVPTPASAPAAASPAEEFSAPVYVVPSQNTQPRQQGQSAQKPVVIPPVNEPVKEDTSLWSRMKKSVSDLFYW